MAGRDASPDRGFNLGGEALVAQSKVPVGCTSDFIRQAGSSSWQNKTGVAIIATLDDMKRYVGESDTGTAGHDATLEMDEWPHPVT